MPRDRLIQELPDGSLQAPDGVGYRSTPERLRRKSGDQLVGSGAAIVTNVYPEGFVYYEGSEARTMWHEIAPRLVIGARPRLRDLQWVGHVWRSDDGRVLLRFDGKH